jgi:hypothetical protein
MKNIRTPHHLRSSFLKSSVFALALTANAAIAQVSLVNYFDFTQYGSVAGGSTLTSNAYGTTQGTLSSTGTTLTSSGLAISSGQLAKNTGVTLSAGSLSSFTGDFSIQTWFTNPATVLTNTMLFGGTNTVSQDSSINGDRALFVGFNKVSNAVTDLRPIVSNNTNAGQDMAAATDGRGRTASTSYDLTLTYVSSSKLLSFYIDGTLSGSATLNTGFTTLAAVTNWAIGGVANPAFADNSVAATFSNFLMYDGALSSTQISNIHTFGSDVTVNELVSAGVTAIPEPSTYAALAGLGALGLAAYRRRRAV